MYKKRGCKFTRPWGAPHDSDARAKLDGLDAEDDSDCSSSQLSTTPAEAPPPPIFAAVETPLDCPFAEKDAAKALGARWRPDMKKWVVPAGVDLRPFVRWHPCPAALADL